MSNLKNYKKISIIGGAGFLGTRLCHRLMASNIPFEIIDLKKSRAFPELTKTADVRDISSLRKDITGDLIINLAAVHRDNILDKNEYYKTNVIGAKNIVKVCREKNIKKIIFTSTVAVYGMADKNTGEDGVLRPFNEYGKTKYQAEKVFESWWKETNYALIIIRPTVIFGEGNRGNVFNLFNQIASQRFLMIGDGKNKKSMAYVENVSCFIEKCIQSDLTYGLYNYVDKPDYDMNSLVTLVNEKIHGSSKISYRIPYFAAIFIGYLFDFVTMCTGKTFLISSIRVKKFCSESNFNSRKNEMDNFVAPISMEEAVNKTIISEFINPDPLREIFFTE